MMATPFSPNPRKSESLPSPSTPHIHLQQAFTHLRKSCNDFLSSHSINAPRLPQVSPPTFDPSSFKSHIESAVSKFQNHAQNAFESAFSELRLRSGAGKNPAWARIGDSTTAGSATMSAESIEDRLSGVPVYTLSNSSQEFVLISSINAKKAVGLFCFKEQDAESLLNQMKTMDPEMREGSRVVAVALSKIFELKLDGVAFRLIPDASQIQNALRMRKKNGVKGDSFSGIPVFQSRSLVLRSDNKTYRPVFFRKEDLDSSLLRASSQQRKMNPALREGDIHVGVLEDIIQGMMDNGTSIWDDVIFIPPGFDVSTAPDQQ
ncbi:protein TIC 22-like, chloroplastic [Impatiens glandulifera]|uniref:protein TIC 22-like, chloroplastic n=1 Tax=Impatiens glandulifera TaxID=253017 RepID=UPI001FB07E9C|nr:protein TIC 22-like, chloroplastic [Impatiens glandulifera]